MDNTLKVTYAEVFEILKFMDKKIVMKTPVEILQFFKDNKEDNYISNINKKDIFNKNNISEDTLKVLSWLNINYWADENKKKDLIKLYRENDLKYEIELKNRYESSHKELFKEKSTNEIILPIVIQEKKNIFKRIFDILRRILKWEKE